MNRIQDIVRNTHLSIHEKSKKLILILSLVLVSSLFFTTPLAKTALAKDPDRDGGQKNTAAKALGQDAVSYDQQQDEFESAVKSGRFDGLPNSDSLSANVAGALTSYGIAVIGGGRTADGQQVFGKGATQVIAGLIDNMYDYQPASTQRYVAYLFESAKIVPTAQAQGIGFSSLDPIMSIWTAFRNVAYLMFVLMFLAIGIMIMFRHKISGQTVVTVQQAIPNIIIALIFVTFSYAIGGFLIDVMYLAMYFIAGMFGNSASMLGSNIFSIGAQYVGGGFKQANEAISAIIDQVDGTGVISGLGGLTVGFIVAIALLFGVVKLFIELLKSYVSIILLITFSPIILMTGAMPGSNSFGLWIKNLLGNLVAFPVVLLVLVVSEAINSYGITTGGFAPPFLLGPSIGGGNALAGLVGVGMLLATPEIVKKAKEKVGAKEGVMGELAGHALGRAKTALPLTSRVAGLGLGTAYGGATGGAVGLAKGLWSGKPLHGMWEGAKSGASKAVSGYDKDVRHPITGKPMKIKMPGALQLASAIPRSIGANQPDILNPVTEAIDKKWNPDEAKRMERIQMFEDAMQHSLSGQDRVVAKQKK